MTAETTPIGFGIIGCGLISDFHAKAIAESRGGRLIGVASRSAEKARQQAEKAGINYFTTDYRDLLKHPDIHVICVTTPSGAHLEAAVEAARAGKHLIVEKPLEITLERVDALIQACADAGVRLTTVYPARFGPGAVKVKEALEAGRFGQLVLASAYVKWHRSAEYYKDSWHGTLKLDGGGALINQAIHAIDLLQWFAGMPKEVFSWNGRRTHLGIEAEDTAVASLRFANGAFGSIEATTAAWPGFQRRHEILGDRGSIVLEDDRIMRWEFREPLPGDEAVVAEFGREESTKAGSNAPGNISHYGHLRQIQDMIEAIHENRPPKVAPAEGRKAVDLICALYESARKGQPVTL